MIKIEQRTNISMEFHGIHGIPNGISWKRDPSPAAALQRGRGSGIHASCGRPESAAASGRQRRVLLSPFISLSPHLFFPLIFIFFVISFVAFDHSPLNVPVILTNIFLHPSPPPPSVGSHSNSRETLHWLVTHCQNLRCFFMVTIIMGFF